MALVRRSRPDVEWPEWFPGRRLFELPDSWRDLIDDSNLRIEEFERDNMHVVRAEMPGLDPDKDVDITVSDHMLHIKAERREETTTDDKKGYRSEFRYGSFVRSLRLPAGATDKDVTATYNDGILEVCVPINADEASAKKVEVTRGS